MKKSQLRKIIRESIKQLMNEQSTTYHRWKGYMPNCSPSGIVQWTTWGNPNTSNPSGPDDFWQNVGSPSPGEFVGMDNTGGAYNDGCWEYLGTSNSFINTWEAIQMGYDISSANVFSDCASCYNYTPPPPPCTSYGCTDSTATNYNSTILPNCDQGCVWLGCTDSTASNYDPVATVDDGSCITTSSCDQSAWGNYSNWLNNFTSLPNFTSTNPNQPCQFLCQRDTQWSAQISTVGPNWANMLQCKLDEVQSLMQTHNCANSNASNC